MAHIFTDWHIYASISINRKMVESFNNARSQDSNSARYGVPTFVPLDPQVDVVEPPITNNKSVWGFNHPVVGKLLCPLRLIPEYETWVVATCTDSWPNQFHSLFKNKVENATIRLRAHDERNRPSFLYPPGTEYNINELNKNLFWGPIFILVSSFLFCAVMLMEKLPTDFMNDLYTEKFCVHR